ncbi:MAG: hypothetical protein QNJ07_03310 [Woeseiaceae bacterium]|nr:hypothetical protein [Woeseiaceae bacterium]
MDGLGAGLVAFAFWGFIASTVVGGIWYAIRENDAKQETLRRMIESGNVDEELIDRVLGGDKDVPRDLKIGGLITLSVSAGLSLLAYFVSRANAEALMPILGAAALVGCIGFGLLAAAKASERSQRRDNANSINRNMAP